MFDKKEFKKPIFREFWTSVKLRQLLFSKKFAVIIEILVVVVAFILLYQFLAKYIPGGIFSSDVLWYMNLSLNNIKDTYVLNRYVHIFLQKLFLESAKTPLIGEQNYWSFLMASTAALTYWNARQLFGRRSIIRSLIAVLIFLSINLFLQFSANVFPDFTVMLIVALFLSVYLASIKKENHSKALLLILGALFYLAFKTKETSILPCVILLPGMGVIANRFNFTLFKKNSILFLAGIMIGVICFAILSGLILKDPFWGLRLSEIKNFISTYFNGFAGNANSTQMDLNNWYSSFLLGSITFPFVFYLFSGITTAPEFNISWRLVWLMPLGLIAFIIPTINVDLGGRFFLPIIPIISVLGSGLINEDVLVRNKTLIFKTGLLVLLGLGLYAGIRIGMRYVLPPLGLNIITVTTVILIPLLFTAMLAVIFMVPKTSYFRNMVILLSLVILFGTTIIFNVKTAINDPLSSNNVNFHRYQEIIYPFQAFSAEIKYSPTMHLATSTGVWSSNLTKNIDEFMCLFNIYYDAGATRQSFIFSDDIDQLISEARVQNFNYILITTDEWNHLISEPPVAADLQGSYQVLTEEKGKFVLLTEK
ncbi:MAG: hypothetical protein ACXVJV_16080 [Mucilaginibacter sp.]